ncbi:MAG: OsmC family protein [Nocardioides sp.]|uniref:OsmC family protein n=1 Tax=Nocardioides sp. TaxID=35761 RepID=UPI003F048769
MSEHHFSVTALWTGNTGNGTTGYRDYARSVTLSVDGKPDLLASADAAFRGEASRWNPEDMLLASLSECHLLSYLHACVSLGVVVLDYADTATATMEVVGNGGRFREAVLHPRVVVADASMVADAHRAHELAHEWCFIANSVNFEVRHEASVVAAG